MNKTWIIFNRRKQDNQRRDGWNYFKEIGVSKQQAEHEMKRQVEKDGQGREWALFEMVSAYAAKVDIVEVNIVDPAEVELPGAEVGAFDVDGGGLQIRINPEPWPDEDDPED